MYTMSVVVEDTVNLLKNRNMIISAAESCTAGMFAAELVSIPGSSAVFRQSYVTYCDEAKTKVLGIDKALLDQYTAVSEQTAEAMVKGVLRITGADIAVSATGYAGPDGGDERNPVGTVYIGCGDKSSINVRRLELSGDRNEIREAAVAGMFCLIQDFINCRHN